jgi:hypothetical protein
LPAISSSRRLGIFALVVLVASTPSAAPSSAPDAELLAGIRQVQEGDFEGAALTLDGVARRLGEDPGRTHDLAQANLYLGIAYVGLDQRPAAKDRFRQAIEADRDLRLSLDRFSPKVLTLFEEARREAEAHRQTPGKGGAKTGWLILGITGAAAATALVVKGTSSSSGTAQFTRARFGTPVIVCPDGSHGQPISFTILVDANNGTSEQVTVNSVTSTIVIVSSDIPSEIGQASSFPSTVTPDTVGAQSQATLTIASTLLCFNDIGDAPRFNEWSGHATLTTSAGVFVLDAADRLRINIP